MELKVKLLHPQAKVPQYAKELDSGFDFFTTDQVTIRPQETIAVPTGVSMKLPSNTELQVRPRSGISLNGVECLVHRFVYDPKEGESSQYIKERHYSRVQFGTVDEGYTGEVKIITYNQGMEDIIIPAGTKLAQGVVAPVLRPTIVVVDSLEETERGSDGFGSTGQ